MNIKQNNQEPFKISDNNQLLIDFDRYLRLDYDNETTRYQYYCMAKKLIKDIYKKTNVEIQTLTQEILEDYVIWLNAKRIQNPNYKGFIHALRRCYDPKERIFWLNTKTNRSRKRTEVEVRTEWLPVETKDEIVKRASPYISLMVDIYFDSCTRKSELLKFDFKDEDKNYSLDLNKRKLKTLGKGNKVLLKSFSPRVAKRIYEWIKSDLCLDKNKPFLIYTKKGNPCKNQGSAFWYRLKRECDFLNIKLPSGRSIFTHSFRHGILHHLVTDLNWPLPMAMKKADHSSIVHTMRYGEPSGEEVFEKEDKEMWGVK